MAKCIGVLLVVMSVHVAVKFQFSEFNMMYHFDDLTYNQFPYLFERVLAYEKRLENNFRTVGEILGDLTVLIEWSNNPLTGHYVAPLKTLGDLAVKFMDSESGKKLSDALVVAAGQSTVADKCQGFNVTAYRTIFSTAATAGTISETAARPLITKAQECWGKLFPTVKDESNDKKDPVNVLMYLANRLITMLKTDSFILHQANATAYASDVINKKCGTVLLPSENDGISKAVSLACNSTKIEPKKEADQKQSIKIIWKTSVFTKVGDTEIYTTLNENGSGIASQNFAVLTFKYAADPTKGLVLIATHFKSKREGAVGRRMLSEAISQYLRTKKEDFKEYDIILTGDLNSSVDEVAMTLQTAIVRLKAQRDLMNGSLGDSATNKAAYKVSRIILPGSIVPRALEVNNELKALYTSWQTYLAAYEKKHEGGIPFFTELKKNAVDLKDAKVEKSLLKEDTRVADPYFGVLEVFQPPRFAADGLWIETNNFPTQHKVRIKEIDFENESYKTCMTSKGKPLSELSAFLNPATVTARSILEFSNTFAVARENWKGDRKKTSLKENEDSRFGETNIADNASCLKGLFEQEKIDYVLIRPVHKFSIQVSTMPKYLEYLQKGFPNDLFSSDHAPTIVDFTIDLTATFDFATSDFVSTPGSALMEAISKRII